MDSFVKRRRRALRAAKNRAPKTKKNTQVLKIAGVGAQPNFSSGASPFGEVSNEKGEFYVQVQLTLTSSALGLDLPTTRISQSPSSSQMAA